MFRFLRCNTVESYGLNCMSLFKSYWTVQGISPDARKSALRAAESGGEELGVWLSRLINKVSVAERNAIPLAREGVEDTGDKLSSIERAMRQPRASGDAGSG